MHARTHAYMQGLFSTYMYLILWMDHPRPHACRQCRSVRYISFVPYANEILGAVLGTRVVGFSGLAGLGGEAGGFGRAGGGINSVVLGYDGDHRVVFFVRGIGILLGLFGVWVMV